MAGQIGKQAIQGLVLHVRGAQLQGLFLKGFVGPQTRMLAGQPVAKIAQGGSSFWKHEEATAYSMAPGQLTRFFGFIHYLRQRWRMIIGKQNPIASPRAYARA